jgi:hypothetical protein
VFYSIREHLKHDFGQEKKVLQRMIEPFFFVQNYFSGILRSAKTQNLLVLKDSTDFRYFFRISNSNTIIYQYNTWTRCKQYPNNY